VSDLVALPYDEVWLVDFEFTSQPGARPAPICLVAIEARTQRRIRLFQGEMESRRSAPYRTDANAVMVAYYASAEIGCHLALGWPPPENVLDLFAEFRCLTNGRPWSLGNGLLGALAWFGLPGIQEIEKRAMRDLAMRGSPYTPDEAEALVDYCESDVRALQALLPCMAGQIDIDRALLRGRFMVAAARIEFLGIPLDAEALQQLTAAWPDVRRALVAQVDAAYGAFNGASFSAARWERWLCEHRIPWPRTETGRLALDDDTFREMARAYAQVAPMQQLRATLGQMRLTDVTVGPDARNRCLLSAFRAKTGRNQPSNTKSIFGPAVWMRGLIRPERGSGLAYIDWSQQEFGIAAALSRDGAMLDAYASGDPYLAFAKQAGLAPPGATKASHPREREKCKACVLAVQYGMAEESLGRRLGIPSSYAQELLDLHRTTYRRFWRWSDGVVNYAAQHGHLHTVFGWKFQVVGKVNERSLRNFPMQGNGAEMLRLACCYATEAGIKVCAPIHDALLIEGPADSIDDIVAATRQFMERASADLLDGFTLRSDATIVRHPEHYMDERGTVMWQTVWAIVESLIPTTREAELCAGAPSV
jgi:DNA polymerase I